jgi:hypothetical protein
VVTWRPVTGGTNKYRILPQTEWNLAARATRATTRAAAKASAGVLAANEAWATKRDDEYWADVDAREIEHQEECKIRQTTWTRRVRGEKGTLKAALLVLVTGTKPKITIAA